MENWNLWKKLLHSDPESKNLNTVQHLAQVLVGVTRVADTITRLHTRTTHWKLTHIHTLHHTLHQRIWGTGHQSIWPTNYSWTRTQQALRPPCYADIRTSSISLLTYPSHSQLHQWHYQSETQLHKKAEKMFICELSVTRYSSELLAWAYITPLCNIAPRILETARGSKIVRDYEIVRFKCNRGALMS